MSRICGLLIEQALVNRGLWDKGHKVTPEMIDQSPKAKSFHRTDILDGIVSPEDQDKALVAVNTNTNTFSPEDLSLLKKLKALKEAGFL